MMAATRASHAQPDFSELDVVCLKVAVYLEDEVIPVGSVGAVVFKHTGGEAYEVEFAEPVRTVLTLRRSDLLLAA